MYLAQELPQDHKEAHQVPRIAREDPLRIATAHILGSSTHRGRNNLARCVHQQLGEPFKDLLNNLGIWLLEIRDTKFDADVCDAPGNLMVTLWRSVSSALVEEEAARILVS